MAQLLSLIPFTGSLGNLSAYRMKGSDKIILRTKGGASKETIKKSPQFENTRRVNAEFGGRSMASSHLMRSLGFLKRLGDYNIAGPLNALIKPIQAMDPVNGWGQRSISFSKCPKLLEGFSLNKNNPFDSILRNPLTHKISKDNMSVHLDIPALIPGINLFVPPPVRQPLYCIAISYGIIPDFYFKDTKYHPTGKLHFKTTLTEYYPVAKGSPAVSLDLQLDVPKMDEDVISSYTHILTVGIGFGMPVGNNSVEIGKYVGAGKILGMV